MEKYLTLQKYFHYQKGGHFAQEGWKSRVLNKLKNFKKSLNNLMAASAVIEAPAVMTAAGQKINRNGQVEYNHAQNKDVKQLRSNLQTIGEAAVTVPTLTGNIKATYQVVRHPVRSAKAVINTAKEAVNTGKLLVSKGKNVINSLKAKLNFKSELDWSPESWFGTRQGYGYDTEDIVSLLKHIPEYLEIERKTKANGTWLKMPDGSIWEGDPRSWVQLMSKDGQKLAMERNFGAVSYLRPLKMKTYPTNLDFAWLLNTKDFALEWSGKNYPFTAKRGSGYFEITYPKNAKVLEFDAKGNIHGEIPHPDPRVTRTTNTDNAVWYSVDHGYDVTKINNVIEGLGTKVNDTIIHENVPRKSLLGNNGNFDFFNKNMYKMLIPTIIGGYSTLNN